MSFKVCGIVQQFMAKDYLLSHICLPPHRAIRGQERQSSSVAVLLVEIYRLVKHTLAGWIIACHTGMKPVHPACVLTNSSTVLTVLHFHVLLLRSLHFAEHLHHFVLL